MLHKARKKAVLLLVAAMAVFGAMGTVTAQDGGLRGDRGERGQRGDRPERRGGPDWQNMSEEQREQMRERMQERFQQMRAEQAQRMRDRLELSEDEFSALAPMIERVQQLAMESASASRSPFGRGDRGDRGGRGGRGGPGGFGGAFGIEPSPQAQAVSDASDRLGGVLEQESPSSDQVKQELAALRQARIALDDALRQAREELRGYLTPKQEATLVLQGLLD